jgi:hypothetical protein
MIFSSEMFPRSLIGILAGASLSLISTHAANAALPLQIFTVTANAPNSSQVLQGEAIFDPNTLNLTFCLAAPFNVQQQCVSSDLSSIISTSANREYVGRADNGNGGNVPASGGQSGQTVPILHPAIHITRIVPSTQAFDGYFVILLSVSANSSGQWLPAIGPAF